MKFRTETERQLFLLEVGCSINETETEQHHRTFVKKRARVVPLLKSFRKSQDSKGSWNSNRLRHIFSMRRFHTSPEGRKFHRQLGRFLATRDNQKTGAGVFLKREELQEMRQYLLSELCFYSSVCEQADIELLIEQISEELSGL